MSVKHECGADVDCEINKNLKIHSTRCTIKINMEQNSKVIKKVTPINLKMLEKCGNNKQLMISKLMNAIGTYTSDTQDFANIFVFF